MNRRKTDRWSRVFVLLIFVMAAVLAADRLLDDIGAERYTFNNRSTASPVMSTPEATPFAGEDYPFLPPTQAPQTPSLTPTLVLTATPPAPLIPLSIVDQTVSADDLPNARATPMGAVSGIVARCEVPGKQFEYMLFDLASKKFRSLSEPFDYLDLQPAMSEQVYAVGAIQNGISVEALLVFPVPGRWIQDQNYHVLGVSNSKDQMLVQRFGKVDPGIYWLDRLTQQSVLLFNWSGILSEVQKVSQLDAVLLQLPDENKVENLFLVDLQQGQVEWLTQYEPLSTRNGRISPNSRRLTYWTEEGVWLIALDGTFSSLSFPKAAYPAWASDSSRLVMEQAGMIMVTNIEGSSLEMLDGGIRGSYPQWMPDGGSIIYWRKTGNTCEWLLHQLNSGTEKTIFTANNRQCQTYSPFSFSSDGKWLLGVLEPGISKDEASGTVVCDLANGKCQWLSYSRYNACDQAIWSTRLLPFVWDFSTDSENWWLIQQVRDGGVSDGTWTLQSEGNFPIIASPVRLGINAENYPFLELTMRVDKGRQGTIYIVTDASRQYDDQKSFKFDLVADGEFHRYRFDLSQWSDWQGVVNGLRIRFSDQASAYFEIDQLRVFATEE